MVAGIILVPLIIIASIIVETVEAPFFSKETVIINQDTIIIDKNAYSFRESEGEVFCWVFQDESSKTHDKYDIKKNDELHILDNDYKSSGISLNFDEKITLTHNGNEFTIMLMSDGLDLSISEKINLLNNCEHI